jgi:hypothetical protein
MRHFTNDVISTLILARNGNATLVLQAIDGTGLARKPVPETANFAPTETWEQILAGSAEVERVMLAGERHGRAELTREPMRLLPGMVCHRQGATEAQLLRRVSGVYVTLKLQRQTGGGGIMRQFRLSDGELLHQAAGSPRDSRLELTATLLGRMGRSDAAPLLAAMAEEEAAISLRWQALRECLALDSGKGFIALSRIASRLDDPLAAPAGALRAQLLEAYPRLATCKDGIHSCPV